VDLDQVKSVGGRNRAATAAVGGGERIGDILHSPFSFADELQRSDHRADLMVKERPCRGADFDGVADPCNIETVKCLDRRFRLTIGGAKSREIVTADK